MSSTRAIDLREHRWMRRVRDRRTSGGGGQGDSRLPPRAARTGAARRPPRRPLTGSPGGSSRRPTTSGGRSNRARRRATSGSSTATTAARSTCTRAGGRHRCCSSTTPRSRASRVPCAGRSSTTAARLKPAGCPEHIDLEFLRWIANYRRDSRARLAELEAGGPGHTRHVLRHPRDARRFLEGVSGTGD